ncbi:hypothetical protein LKO27_10865 [Tessaracoccus sp. OS52]|uniref:hypothetical protein n=1 Tax=Tessaracoccus sp. OS52 TaxID=2886691 RepID=UPI001D111BC3|nr:hypothetical protein [Tessaracoccus sp. OS52]MCC2593905.1 hypothetical protein [Tessaracoccus sp. OS52]
MRKLLANIATVVLAVAASLGAAHAVALPVAPPPVTPVSGIPAPCPVTNPWPGDDAGIDEISAAITETFGFKLAGKQWNEANRPSIKILWETLDAVGCTDYVAALQAKVKGNVGINANRISGWAWGDWSLTRTSYVTLDFAKFQSALDAGDEGRLVRLVIHELAHVLNSDRHSAPAYWQEFRALYAQEGRFSDYAGRSISETFADVVGYYVGRCALDNPYDSGENADYYEFAKEQVFGGKEFGPEPGVKPECTVPDADAEEPKPGAAEDALTWVEAVSEE